MIYFARDFQSLNNFLREIVLYTGKDLLEKDTENISILTLHSAKGLEFKNVFIVGCEDKLLPYSLFDKNSDIEEEKRLLYVGMTRAIENLFLSFASSRYISGLQYESDPSPFVKKFDSKLDKFVPNKSEEKEQEISNRQLSIF